MVHHIIYSEKFSASLERFDDVVIEHPDLSKKALRVFIFLCCRMTSKYFTKVDKGQIATSLGISKGDVSDALDELEKSGILTSGSDEHVSKGYKFTYVEDGVVYDE